MYGGAESGLQNIVFEKSTHLVKIVPRPTLELHSLSRLERLCDGSSGPTWGSGLSRALLCQSYLFPPKFLPPPNCPSLSQNVSLSWKALIIPQELLPSWVGARFSTDWCLTNVGTDSTQGVVRVPYGVFPTPSISSMFVPLVLNISGLGSQIAVIKSSYFIKVEGKKKTLEST